MAAHPEATIDRALILLLFGTPVTQVSKILAEEFGTPVTPQTLTRWRDRDHVDRYNALHEKHKEEIEGDAIRRMRERLRLVDQAEMLAVSRVITDLENDKLGGKEASMAALNMSRVKAQNVEKLMQLTGRPTQIIEDKSGTVTDQVLRELMGKGVLRLPSSSTNGDSPED